MIVALAGLGGLVRILIGQQDWLWLDELHTAWVTSGSFSDVATRAAQGNQSPLFFWLVWPAVQLLGNSAVALRVVPLVTGIATIVVASWLAWKWTDSVIATFVVGWLITIDPWFVFYGTEARPYVLLQLLSVFQVILFWRMLDPFYSGSSVADFLNHTSGRRTAFTRGILLVAVSAAMFYCHYTCVWLFAAEVIFFAGYGGVLKFKSGKTFQLGSASLAFVFIAAAIVMLCLPALFQLFEVYGRRNNWELVSSPGKLLNELRWPLLLRVLLPVICATIFFFPSHEKLDFELFDLQPTERNIAKISFVLLWAFVPIAAVLLLAYYQVAPLALYRYTLVGSVAIPLFAGLCVALSSKWYCQLAIAIILVGASFFQNPLSQQLMTTATVPRLRFENWSDPIHEINSRDDKQTHPVFLFSNLIEDVHAFATDEPDFQEYLRFPIQGITRIDARQREKIAAPTISHQHFRPTDIELIKKRGGAWLLIRGDQGLVNTISSELRALAKKSAKTLVTEPSETAIDEGLVDESSEPRSGYEPSIQFAEFPLSNVYLVSVDW